MALQAVEVCAMTDLILTDSRGGGGFQLHTHRYTGRRAAPSTGAPRQPQKVKALGAWVR